MKIKHKLEKGVLCYFHKQHTDNIISVSLETGGYAILRKKIDKDDNSAYWYLLLFRYKKYRWSKKIAEMTVFKNEIKYRLRHFILDKKIAKRQKNIQHAFPDALDMLVICSEAGLSLDAAIQRVTIELHFSHPILAEEFGLVIAEMQAGVDRKTAMKGLAERTGVKDVRGLMATLTQCMMFGTSVTEALRVYSEDLRDRRMQAAEETAAKIGAKMIFPLAVCLMPAFMLIVMAPVFLSLTKALNF